MKLKPFEFIKRCRELGKGIADGLVNGLSYLDLDSSNPAFKKKVKEAEKCLDNCDPQFWIKIKEAQQIYDGIESKRVEVVLKEQQVVLCCCGSNIRMNTCKCVCNWDGWVSRYDWPIERKNLDVEIRDPVKEDFYLIRYQKSDGNRIEEKSKFNFTPRIVEIDGKKLRLYWTYHNDGLRQPYAWKNIK